MWQVFALLGLANSATAAFHHRQRSSTIIINNVLYIDNGEIVTWSRQGTGYASNGSAAGDFSYLPDNNTYSIDLSVAWTNTSVTLNTISKSAPVLVSGALWPDEARKTFYSYDGAASFVLYDHVTGVLPTVTSNQLWQFTPDGLSGSWSQVSIAGNGSNLVRLGEVTYAGGGGLGFALGGLQTAGTAPNLAANTGFEAYNGMVVYNMTSNTWRNVSAGYDYARGSLVGAGLFVPAFGPQGVFMAFGGITDQQSQIPLDNAFIYEPSSQKWAIQAVTGDKPPGSNNPCVVGVQGDNGTYEVFLYGGIQPTNSDGNRIIDGAVYVLTLPAFHWQRVPASVYGRYRHTCNVAGNRQMISVGGIVFPGPLSNDSDIANGAPDPWPNGLGVFDMTELEWKASYQPSASAYLTPQLVKMYYESNGRYPSSWTAPEVQAWFQTDSKLSTTSSSSPSASASSSGSTSTSTSSPNNTAAIIGGAVAGGVVALALALGLIYLWRRRSRRQQSSRMAELGAESERRSLDANQQHGKPHVSTDMLEVRPELDGRSHVFEAPNRHLVELDGRPKPQEMDGRSKYERDLIKSGVIGP